MQSRTLRNVESGFTLVEIMVVVFVIGITVGLAALSMGGHSERQLENEVQRLFQKMRLITDEAEFSKNEYGLSLSNKNGYLFYQFDEQQMEWVKIDKDFFKPVELTDDFKLILDVSESKLDSSALYAQQKKEKVTDYGEKSFNEPQVIFYSDGQITPFELSFLKQIPQ